jgi:hypothetical protein
MHPVDTPGAAIDAMFAIQVDAGFTLSTDAVSQTKKAAATTYNYTVASPLKSASDTIDKAVSTFTNDPEGVVPAARKKVAEAWDGAATVPSKMYAGTVEAMESLRDRLQKSVNTGLCALRVIPNCSSQICSMFVVHPCRRWHSCLRLCT